MATDAYRWHRTWFLNGRGATGTGCGLILAFLLLGNSIGLAGEPSPMPGGELRILAPDGSPAGACPLKHTDVEADIIGFFSRARVRQTFHNPLDRKIEAVYVFPLPHNAAVDDMVMTVGDRRVVGQIKPRDEAREIYEAARAAGHVTSLLDQERPNIFTQSVANIEPGAEVVIEISYVDTLEYEDGVFEFVFPMVIGPRYMPGLPTGKQGSGWAPDTTQVPDASRISPPVAPPGTRAGHDISLTVHLDAGMELLDLESDLHEVDVEMAGLGRATVALKNKAEIPNKDFILRYRTATDEISDAFLVHSDERGTFFTLILQPPRHVLPAQAVPKEMIFVIDRSGSMSGFPIDKAKETMRLAIEQMNPHDTFNLLSFSGGTGSCFDKPVPNTPTNRAIALKYLADLYGSGGTEMMSAIRAALEGPTDPERVRIVSFMTDGYIGNDFAIIDAVKQNAGSARVFAFGIGNAVNRFLLDGMAHAGRGEVEYVTLQSQGEEAAERFHERIHSPVLTDIEIDWGTLQVTDVYPRHYPDLFSSKPILIHGRLTGAAMGTLTLRGRMAAGPFERQVRVEPSAEPAPHDALASLWARAAIADLMMRDYTALQRGDFPEPIREEVTALGVAFRLMTQFTSFVAVEEMTVTVGGEPTTIAVPVEIPAGVSYEGIFGDASFKGAGRPVAQALAPAMRGIRESEAFAPSRFGYRLNVPEQRESDRTGGPPREPESHAASGRLAQPLRGLWERVAKEGRNGNLTVGDLQVVDYRVDVMIYLRDMSAETIDALNKLGFVRTGEGKAVRLLIGTIDVRKLESLAKLDAVVRVSPVIG